MGAVGEGEARGRCGGGDPHPKAPVGGGAHGRKRARGGALVGRGAKHLKRGAADRGAVGRGETTTERAGMTVGCHESGTGRGGPAQGEACGGGGVHAVGWSGFGVVAACPVSSTFPWATGVDPVRGSSRDG